MFILIKIKGTLLFEFISIFCLQILIFLDPWTQYQFCLLHLHLGLYYTTVSARGVEQEQEPLARATTSVVSPGQPGQ